MIIIESLKKIEKHHNRLNIKCKDFIDLQKTNKRTQNVQI